MNGLPREDWPNSRKACHIGLGFQHMANLQDDTNVRDKLLHLPVLGGTASEVNVL